MASKYYVLLLYIRAFFRCPMTIAKRLGVLLDEKVGT